MSVKSAPATIRRALFLWALLVRVFAAPPGTNPPPELPQVNLPDAAESQRILTQFRQSGIPGDYYLEFELHQLPRRGDETVFRGQLWGSRNEQGAVTRVSLLDANRAERRFLVQNGPQAAVWLWIDGRVTKLEVNALFEPLVPGVNLNPFDLQMPFLYWPDAKVVAITRVLGRPAHTFLFHPPAEFVALQKVVGSVRGYFDTQFSVPTQIETFDPSGKVSKTLSLVDLKKVDGQYIPKTFEVRDEVSRDKTRFAVTAAALNLRFTADAFAPGALGDAMRPPTADKIERLR